MGAPRASTSRTLPRRSRSSRRDHVGGACGLGVASSRGRGAPSPRPVARRRTTSGCLPNAGSASAECRPGTPRLRPLEHELPPLPIEAHPETARKVARGARRHAAPPELPGVERLGPHFHAAYPDAAHGHLGLHRYELSYARGRGYPRPNLPVEGGPLESPWSGFPDALVRSRVAYGTWHGQFPARRAQELEKAWPSTSRTVAGESQRDDARMLGPSRRYSQVVRPGSANQNDAFCAGVAQPTSPQTNSQSPQRVALVGAMSFEGTRGDTRALVRKSRP